MGNYYKGQVELVLKKDVPAYILDILLDLNIFEENYLDYEKRLHRLKKRRESFFKCKHFDMVKIHIGPVLKSLYGEDRWFSDLMFYCACADVYNTYKCNSQMDTLTRDIWQKENENLFISGKYTYENLTISAVNRLLKVRIYDNIRITASCLINGYSNELEEFINLLKPYLIENHTLVVGYLQDENGTCNKTLNIWEG